MEREKAGSELTEKQREELEVMAGLGLPIRMIAAIFGMTSDMLDYRLKVDPDLRMRFDRGVANATKEVAKTAYHMAVVEKQPAMIMFWLKCRANWKETNLHLHKALTLEDVIVNSREVLELNKGKSDE